ncbi:MAG: zinc metallopeptidase, partial [Christensenellales bacterium]
MSEFIDAVRDMSGGWLDGVSEGIILAMSVVVGLLIIVSIFAMVISVYLAVSYMSYNKKQNSCLKTGEEIARTILDNHGLGEIKVSKTGSILFGNSYSHYFKKVRLRRLTWQKQSVTSLAMAAQKSSLAVLDKENDSDMKIRIRLTPLIYFGPVAFVPLVIIGVLLDMFLFKNTGGYCGIVLTTIGLVFYLISFIMA